MHTPRKIITKLKHGTNLPISPKNPSIKFGSITPSKNGQMDLPNNTLALGQTEFYHENTFSFQN